MPEKNLVIVPNDYPLEKAALVEPLAVGWHTAKLAVRALDVTMEKRALVIGGGAIGLATALALNAMGIDDLTISEFNPLRRENLLQHIDAKVVEKAEGSFPIVIDEASCDAKLRVEPKPTASMTIGNDPSAFSTTLASICCSKFSLRSGLNSDIVKSSIPIALSANAVAKPIAPPPITKALFSIVTSRARTANLAVCHPTASGSTNAAFSKG
jgi:hypothetical protein